MLRLTRIIDTRQTGLRRAETYLSGLLSSLLDQELACSYKGVGAVICGTSRPVHFQTEGGQRFSLFFNRQHGWSDWAQYHSQLLRFAEKLDVEKFKGERELPVIEEGEAQAPDQILYRFKITALEKEEGLPGVFF